MEGVSTLSSFSVGLACNIDWARLISMGACSQFATFRLALIGAKQRESPHLSWLPVLGAMVLCSGGFGVRVEDCLST